MNKNIPHAILSAMFLIIVSFCSGCSTISSTPPHLSKDEYKAIFSDAISKSLNTKNGNNVCLSPTFGMGAFMSDTVEVNLDLPQNFLQMPTGQASQLKALEAAGLLVSSESERKVMEKMQKFRTYKRTEKGEHYYVEGKFCYAQAELDKILKWKGPITLDEYRAAWVYFTVKTTKVADWATIPEILAAFPTAKSTLQDTPPKVHQTVIDLSSEGWEVNEWSKLLQ